MSTWMKNVFLFAFFIAVGMIAFCNSAEALCTPKYVTARVMMSDTSFIANADITIKATDANNQIATYTGGGPDPDGVIMSYTDTTGAIVLNVANFSTCWASGDTLTIAVESPTESGSTSIVLDTSTSDQNFNNYPADLDFKTSACDATAAIAITTTDCATKEVTFDTTGTTSPGGAISIDYGDGSAAGTILTHTYPDFNTDYTATITALGTNPAGCSSTASVTVNITNNANAAFTVATDALEATFTIDGGAVGTLTLDYGDGSVTATVNAGDAVTHNYAAGSYTAELTAVDGGCTDIATQAVNVSCDASAVFGTPTINGLTVDFPNAAGSSTADTLAYDWGDGNTADMTTHSYASAGTYTVTLTATRPGGCTDTATTDVTVTCDASVALSASNTAGTLDAVVDTAGSTGNTGGTVDVDYGDGTVNTVAEGATDNHTYAAGSSYTITVTGAGTGCTPTQSQTLDVCDSAAAIAATTTARQVSVDTSGSSGTLSIDFGDGTAAVTPAGNPTTHDYAADGTYTITLTATGTGCSKTATTDETVACDATATLNSSISGMTATFTPDGVGDLSLDYGDGTAPEAVTAGTPVTHTYALAKTYTATLTSTRPGGCTATATATVMAVCDAVATFTYTTNLLEVTFDTTGSTGTESFDYGDGNTGPDLVHTYAASGTYTVTLTTTGVDNCTATYSMDVTVCNAVATFTADDTIGGLDVGFDATGSVGDTFEMDYGDGTTSGAVATVPTTYTYANGGVYEVTLTATDTATGCQAVSDPVTVDVTDPNCIADANFSTTITGLTVNFDISNTVGDLSIDYGDGSAAGTAGGDYTYATGGVYTVIVDATDPDSGCVHTVSKVLTVCDTVADFTATSNQLDASFDVSNAVGTPLEFNFGDGSTGAATSPTTTHTYSSAGTYTVTLTAGSGTCQKSTTQQVVITDTPPCDAVAALTVTVSGSSVTCSTAGSVGDSLMINYGDGTTTTATSHTYASGGTYTVTLTASNTQIPNCSDTAQQTVTVTGGSVTPTPGPTPVYYRLTISADPAEGGIVSPESGKWYTSGATVDITATEKAGYKFTGWEGDVADKIDPTTTVTMSSNKTVTAKFEEIETVELTMEVTPEGAGTTIPTVAGSPHKVEKGTQKSITAEAVDGYSFVRWEGTGIVLDPKVSPNKVRMDDTKTVIAVFEEIKQVTLTIAVSPDGAGTTYPEGGEYTLNTGTTTIQAFENPGWRFVGWKGEGIQDKMASTSDLNLTQDQTVTAEFVKLYNLTMKVEPADGGTTNPAAGKTHPVPAGSQDILATPAQGYTFGRWEGTGIAETGLKMTTINMDRNKTATAVFIAGEAETRDFGFVKVTAPTSGSAFISAELVGLSEMPDHPEGVNFQYGLIDMEATSLEDGQVVEYTFTFEEPLPAGAAWYVYDEKNGWYEYPKDKYEIDENDRKTVTVQMMDNAYGDSDDVPGQVTMRSGYGVRATVDSGGGDGGGSSTCFISSSADRSPNSGNAGVVGMFAAMAMLAVGFIVRKEK